MERNLNTLRFGGDCDYTPLAHHLTWYGESGDLQTTFHSQG